MASTATAGTIWFWTEAVVVATPPPYPRDKNPLPLIQTIQHKSPI